MSGPAHPASQHFHAIVLAGGRGSRMTQLTDHVPKALLPVANVPLFWYPLRMLARSGFTDALLVVNGECRQAVEQKLSTPHLLPPLGDLAVEVETVCPEGG